MLYCVDMYICILHHSNVVYAIHSFMIYILLSSHNTSSQLPFLNCNNSKCVSDACSPLCSLLHHTAPHHCRIIITSDGKLFLGPCLLPSYTPCKWQKARHACTWKQGNYFLQLQHNCTFQYTYTWVPSHVSKTEFRETEMIWKIEQVTVYINCVHPSIVLQN